MWESIGAALLTHSHPLLTLPHALFSLLFEKLLLLGGAHVLEESVALLSLLLVRLLLSLLGFLFIGDFGNAPHLVLADSLDLAHDLGPEVGVGDELVGEAQEGGPDGHGLDIVVRLGWEA
jgi:hypothetical protein